MAKSTPNLNEPEQVYQRLPTSQSKTELENDEIDQILDKNLKILN